MYTFTFKKDIFLAAIRLISRKYSEKLNDGYYFLHIPLCEMRRNVGKGKYSLISMRNEENLMPKYEDLQFLKNKIVNIGNEREIEEKRGSKANLASIPQEQEESSPVSESFQELFDDSLIDDITNTTEQVFSSDSEPEIQQATEEESERSGAEEGLSFDLDDLLTSPVEKSFDETEDLLSSLEKEKQDENVLEKNIENLTDDDLPLESSSPSLDSKLVSEEEHEEEKEESGAPLESDFSLDSLDDLLGAPEEPQEEEKKAEPSAGIMDLGELGDLDFLNMEDQGEELPDLFSDGQDMESLFTADSGENASSDDENRRKDTVQEAENLDVPASLGEGQENPSVDLSGMLNEFSLSGLNDGEKGVEEEQLPDLSMLDHFTDMEDDLMDEENRPERVDSEPVSMDEDVQEELSSAETVPSDSTEDFSKETSSETGFSTELTPEERKKVILTISTFPKEAELKIAKAIVDKKYSDKKIMPLVRALVDHSPQDKIIKVYENITKDKSLAKLAFRKYTGEYFERRQKSFLYNLEKNILPILARIASIVVVILILCAFYITVLYPTYTASKYYKLGKKNIEAHNYDYVEPNFEEAYRIQPRYKEILAYARKYREQERYIDAEKKYQMAAELRDDRKLDLEYADFFREIKKYERALSVYNYWVERKRSDIKARLGRGETYFDWAAEQRSKLDDAENEFLEVLDFDEKNQEAVDYLMLTYMKKDDLKKVLDTYQWGKVKCGKPNYLTYTRLASYLIDKGEINEVKHVLAKITQVLPKKIIFPELDYQMARYNRALQVRGEERICLERAEKKLDLMSNSDIRRMHTNTEFARFKASIYNDLGENYYDQSKTNIDAEKMFLKAIDTDPDYAKPYFNLGNFEYRTKGNREKALNNYLEAEKRGFSNDIMTYNLGWLYYKAGDYYESYKRVNQLLNQNPDNDNLKFMAGTTLFQLGKYDLAASMLQETYHKFEVLKQANAPLDLDIKEHRYIVAMLCKTANNLGTSLREKYEQTRKYPYFTDALKYFTTAVEYFDLMDTTAQGVIHASRKPEKAAPYLNLKMALYPDVFGETLTQVEEDFDPFEFLN